MKGSFSKEEFDFDLVKLRGKVVHPVANNPLPDELALALKPDSGFHFALWITFFSFQEWLILTSLELFCSVNWTSGSCQTSCARSASRTSIVKCKICPLLQSTLIWSSVKAKPVKLAIFLSIPSWSCFRSSYLNDVWFFFMSSSQFNMSATNRTWCWGGFSSSNPTQASQKIHRGGKGLADRSPWWRTYFKLRYCS